MYRAQRAGGEALHHLMVSRSLKDFGLAAVADGDAAMEKLLEQLADVPTPAGPTPHELGNRVSDGEG
jgi:hypothetical protein